MSTKPAFQGGLLKHTSSQLIPKWLHLNEMVSTGRPAAAVNQEGAGSEFFQQFVVDIFPMSYPSAQVLAKHLALGKAGTRRGCWIWRRVRVYGVLRWRKVRTGQGDGRGLGRSAACDTEDGSSLWVDGTI